MHRIAVLTLPSVFPLEFGIATQIFAVEPSYELAVCAAGPVSGAGFELTAEAGLDALDRADTVIVPGCQDIDSPLPDGVPEALRAAHGRGTRLVSLCSGAFVLAAAGLLDGRPATTHWQRAGELQRRHPRVDVRPNQLYVDDGDILTSAGVTAGIDLCLHLIRTDRGAAAANTRARSLVAPPQRPGGQSQYVERFQPPARGRRLAAVRDWMRANLAAELTVDGLAEQAHLSRRTLVRRFREETGTSPMAWLTAVRIDHARELLETTDEPVERIGRLSGLGAPASVRAVFHRHLGASPQQYRTLFRHGADEPAARLDETGADPLGAGDVARPG